MSFFSTNKDFDASDRKLKRSHKTSIKVVYYARVIKVIYDYEKDAEVSDISLPYPPGTIEVESIKTELAGTIRFAFPLDESSINLPVVNEIVEIFIVSNQPFYRRRNLSANINNAILSGFYPHGAGSKPLPDVGLSDYKTGLGGTNSTSNNIGGETDFKKESINRLRLFNGDTILQSRFGQSIRFSGYNNEFSQEHPTIIIRNRETVIKDAKKGFHTISEDINKDGSTIAITSGKYKSKFIPGLIDKSGKSNFKLKAWQSNSKYALEDYPKELTGDQIIITSGRLIFSSRTAETIFFSKGWLGFVTDEAISIDSMRGMNIISHKGNIDIEAKEKDIVLDVGKKGKIYLGRGMGGKKLYPAVNGKPLIDLIGRILDTMENLANAGILTSAGPATGNTPITITEIDKYRREMVNMLSKTVWIEE